MKDRAKILLIDDDVDFIEISKLALARSGFEVLAAYNAHEGWEMIEKENPNLIILDLMMESLDSGITLGRRVKNDPRYAAIPILMLTSITRDTGMDFSPRDRDDLQRLQVDEYCIKPIPPKILIAKVKELLSRNPRAKIP